MNVLDLFSGIGGFSLGLERAGMRTVAFCEIDPFCRKIIAKNFPGRPIYDDVRTLTAARLMADAISGTGGCSQRTTFVSGDLLEESKRQKISNGPSVSCNWTGIDLICGGFPCQDISVAGKGAGIGGERSGLWSEYARIIGEVRPRYVIVENVAALLGRGLARVLGDLAALGFDAEWHCIPASAVGAPHRRDRIWIVGHAQKLHINGRSSQSASCDPQVSELGDTGCPINMANAASARRDGTRSIRSATQNGTRTFCELARSNWWFTEPDVGRVAHGVPARVDRLRSLGNAVVPQVVEIIGRAIMSSAT